MKVKIYGSGSIGNHLAQASRRMGWEVAVVDLDPKALERMKNEIYPVRYGAWDEKIELYEAGKEPKGGFDIICVGTPPHVRIPLAIELLKEKPKILHLEKPLCGPKLEKLDEFLKAYRAQKDTTVLVGYDHAVAASTQFVVDLLKKETIGNVETLDVEFREHWGGIFKAHPWLSGPQDSYLGFTAKGGGASGEHSHALHLWQYLAGVAGLGEWVSVAPVYKMVKTDVIEYDAIASFSFITNTGDMGRVIQDVVTSPTRKWARLQGLNGFIEWSCNGVPEGDLVRFQGKDGKVEEKIFPKKRPDDFYQETLHFEEIIKGQLKGNESPISFEGALSVMSVLSTVFQNKEGSHIPIKSIEK